MRRWLPLVLALAAASCLGFTLVTVKSPSLRYPAAAASGYLLDRTYFEIVTATNDAPMAVTLTSAAAGTTIDWGDGNSTNITATGSISHTNIYTTAGTYTMTLRGAATAVSFNHAMAKPRLKKVLSQVLGLTNMTSLSFQNCTALTVPGTNNTLVLTALASLSSTWNNCSAATNFPAVNTLISNTTLASTWNGCSAMIIPPDVSALTKVTTLSATWINCTAATNFPAVNTLISNTTLASTWAGCSQMVSPPEVSTLTNVTILNNTWQNCTAATNFPAVNTLIAVTSMAGTWDNCRTITALPEVSALTAVTTLQNTWKGCVNLITPPDVSNLTNVIILTSTWGGCNKATTFPAIDALVRVVRMDSVWNACYKMTNAPTIPASNLLTNVNKAFYRCWAVTNNLPDLWNAVSFPNIIDYTDCFDSCSNALNWADVPVAWR